VNTSDSVVVALKRCPPGLVVKPEFSPQSVKISRNGEVEAVLIFIASFGVHFIGTLTEPPREGMV
jgi:hypothetical protein